MILYTLTRLRLDTYYRSPPGICSGNNQVIRAEKCGLSPYEIEETLYYLCKDLGLPGISSALFVLMITFRIFDNFFNQLVYLTIPSEKSTMLR